MEFTQQIPFFLENFLSKPASALPKGAQWLLLFSSDSDSNGSPSYSEVLPVQAIKKGISYEPESWDIDKAIEITLQSDYQDIKGCLFVQAVQIPGESNVVNPEGIQQNGFIRSQIGGGRDAYSGMQIVFLETNISFVDNVIRPWVIATSHLGMIARKGADNYRCRITAYKLGLLGNNEPPTVVQKYTFYGACPISIEGEEYNYSPASSPINRSTTFTYHYYSLESVKSLNNNKLPNSTISISTTTPEINQPTIVPSTITPEINQPTIVPSTITPEINQPTIAPSPPIPENSAPFIAPSTITPEINQPTIAPSPPIPENSAPSIAPSLPIPENSAPFIAPSLPIPENSAPFIAPSTTTPEINQPTIVPSLPIPEDPTPLIAPNLPIPEDPALIIAPNLPIPEDPTPLIVPSLPIPEDPTPLIVPSLPIPEDPISNIIVYK